MFDENESKISEVIRRVRGFQMARRIAQPETGFGLGVIGNIVVGIVGSFIAGWLLSKIGVKSIVKNEIVDQIIFAFIGAVILPVILGLLSRSGLLHS
jgi:uncharacterized membrane protein YeaQ/YmgE (transglycosylase-associated protein family)